jgi:hypothetical protein
MAETITATQRATYTAYAGSASQSGTGTTGFKQIFGSDERSRSQVPVRRSRTRTAEHLAGPDPVPLDLAVEGPAALSESLLAAIAKVRPIRVPYSDAAEREETALIR